MIIMTTEIEKNSLILSREEEKVFENLISFENWKDKNDFFLWFQIDFSKLDFDLSGKIQSNRSSLGTFQFVRTQTELFVAYTT